MGHHWCTSEQTGQAREGQVPRSLWPEVGPGNLRRRPGESRRALLREFLE